MTCDTVPQMHWSLTQRSARMSSAPQVHGVEVVGRSDRDATAVFRLVQRAGSATDGAHP